MIVTICVILFLSLLVLHVVLRFNEAQRLLNKIPGPVPLPFLGNLLMLRNISTSGQLWNILCDFSGKYYPTFRLYGFTRNIVFIRHPEDLKILLSCKNNIEKSEIVYGGVKRIDGIVVSGGEKWQQRRKMLNPAFNPDLLKVYVGIANEHIEKFVKNIKNQNHVLIPDLVKVMNKLAMEVICEAAMGSDSNIFYSEEAEEFRDAFLEAGEVAIYRSVRPYIKDWMMRFLSMGRKSQHAMNKIREFSGKIIQERREYHKKTGYRYMQNKSEDDVFTGQKKRLAILDLLLAAEIDNLIDETGISEELETIILAGYETTGVAVTFALMLLAEHAEAQDIARKEVTEIMNQTGGVLTMSDLLKLNYLDRCIKETLRLYPSAPVVGRNIKHEITLSKYKIPHGTEMILNFFALHRDPNFWSHPEKFDPDRFLHANVEERHPFAYMPFSAGPRSCIGSKFAMLEAKAIVARILFNFYLEPVTSTANVKLELHFSFKTTEPCSIKLIKILQK